MTASSTSVDTRDLRRWWIGSRKYREVFFAAHGPGPHLCWLCDLELSFIEIFIHHLNGNHDDNDPENLTSMHEFCHRAIHMSKPKSPEHLEALRRSFKLRSKNEQWLERIRRSRATAGPKIAAKLRGRIFSDEHKKNISTASKERWKRDSSLREKLAEARRRPEVRARIREGVRKAAQEGRGRWAAGLAEALNEEGAMKRFMEEADA